MECATALFWPCPLEPYGRAKRSNIIKFQRFSYQTLRVSSQIKEDIKHFEWDFHFEAWVMPKGRDLECFLGGGGVKNLILSNVVMWHIKLKGIMSRTGYK